MPERTSPNNKNRGTMLHKPYSGKRVGLSPAKMKREVTPSKKAVSGQPAYSKNRKPSDRLFGGA